MNVSDDKLSEAHWRLMKLTTLRLRLEKDNRLPSNFDTQLNNFIGDIARRMIKIVGHLEDARLEALGMIRDINVVVATVDEWLKQMKAKGGQVCQI
jgi:hypothetical protein